MSFRWPGWRGRLPLPAFALATKLVPIACVDVLPFRVNHGKVEVGLIQRKDANGYVVWNLIGGGIHRRESVADAASRHIHMTLGPHVTWERPDFSQPKVIGEYFPVPVNGAGHDPRKHAIGLSYPVLLSGKVLPQGEALGFRWFSETDVPFDEIGFGQDYVVRRLLPVIPPSPS
jgi:ADP-ribose pyrophosphatase YjhB (NUDIX family)